MVGTAGHVDHGKSSLVRALTGTDPDRLKEERERGITIDLGFAHVPERDGLVLSFVDVPGHERFVRNMLAGAAGVDVVLLVVAADESVMPQTREHLDICRLLGVPLGVVALTKSDLVDDDTLALVRLELADLVAGTPLESAPVIACSATTRAGLDDLADALHDVATRAPERPADGPFRMPIDRSFTVRGFGTVVTGTASSGRVAGADEVELLPVGRSLRVRGVQVHGSGLDEGRAGQRVAVNLGAVDHREVERGDVIVSPGSHVATSVLDVDVRLLPGVPEVKDLARVRLHVGTAEVMARLRWAKGSGARQGGQAQLRLERQVVAAAGDRYILRRYSPVTTLGGGVVLHPAPASRLRPSDETAATRLGRMAACLAVGGPRALLPLLIETAPDGRDEGELARWTGLRSSDVRGALAAAEAAGDVVRVSEAPLRFLARARVDEALDVACARLEELHRREPLAPGHARLAVRMATGLDESVFDAAVARGLASGRLAETKDALRLPKHEVRLSDDERRALPMLQAAFASGGLQPPDLDAVLASLPVPKDRGMKLVRLLTASGELVRIKEGMFVHGPAMVGLLKDMASWNAPGQAFSVPEFKDRSRTSRKHAIPLLEYLDGQGLTRRVGEGRIWMGRAAP